MCVVIVTAAVKQRWIVVVFNETQNAPRGDEFGRDGRELSPSRYLSHSIEPENNHDPSESPFSICMNNVHFTSVGSFEKTALFSQTDNYFRLVHVPSEKTVIF